MGDPSTPSKHRFAVGTLVAINGCRFSGDLGLVVQLIDNWSVYCPNGYVVELSSFRRQEYCESCLEFASAPPGMTVEEALDAIIADAKELDHG